MCFLSVRGTHRFGYKKGWSFMKRKMLFVSVLLLVVLGVMLALYVKHNKSAGVVATPSSATDVQQKTNKGLAGLNPQCVGDCGDQYKECLDGVDESYKVCATWQCNLALGCIQECTEGSERARAECGRENSTCLGKCKPVEK